MRRQVTQEDTTSYDGEDVLPPRYVEPLVTSQRAYHGRVLLCLTPAHPFRRAIIRLIEWPWFDRIVLLLICLNCIYLATQQPWGSVDAWEAVVELVFQALFTVELVCKVVAMGFVLHTGSYLRDGWNWVDFAVVVVGWLAFFPEFQNVSAIRSIRVFRPLRTITRIRGMRLIVSSMLDSIPMMANALLLFVCALFFLGVIGVQLFMGRLQYRCYADLGAEEPVEDTTVCGCDVRRDAWPDPPQVCPPGLRSFYECPGSQVCRLAPLNPNNGVTSFDHLGHAVYNIFQALTLEGWVDITYMLEAGHSPVGGVLYMVIVVGFLAFFVVNLFLAVIFLSFENQRRRIASEEAAAAEARQRAEQAAALHDYPNNWASRVIAHKAFTPAVTFLIVVNTALMAVEYHGMPAKLANALEVSNWVLTGLFALELLLKIVGLGWRGYVRDRFNIFDAVIVLISVVEILLAALEVIIPGNLSVLRAFRLLRVFKLARSWSGLQKVLTTVLSSLNSIAYLAGILLLIMFIFALLGMQLFGRIYGDPRDAQTLEETPPTNFNNLGWALITIFVCISGENWNEVFFDTIGAMRAQGQASNIGVAYLYFVALIVVGNFVLINLFVAILLSNFESTEELSGEYLRRERAVRVLQMLKNAMGSQRSLDLTGTASDQDPPRSGGRFSRLRMRASSRSSRGSGANAGQPRTRSVTAAAPGADEEPGTAAPAATALPAVRTPIRRMTTALAHTPSTRGTNDSFASKPRSQYPRLRESDVLEERSLLCLDRSNPLRVAAARLVCHPRFDMTIMALIFISTVALILDSPFETNATMTAALYWTDVVLTVLFGCEMVVKVVAFGLAFTKRAYLRDPSNVLDAFIVLVSVLSLALDGQGASGLASLRALRALRALRPLRLISRNPGMKVVIDVLYKSVPAVSNVCLIFLLFLLIFAILGVQLFAGRLGACTDTSVHRREACVGTYTREDGKEVPRVWSNPHVGNFDFIGNSTLLLFEMTTLEMWPDAMFATIDASPSQKDVGPERDANPAAALFSVTWIIVGSFFMLNLFVGAVIDNFNRIKEQETGTALLTNEQREWVEMNHMMLSLRVPDRVLRPVTGPRRWVFVFVEHPVFEAAIAVCIILNALAIAVVHLGQPDEMTEVLYWANYGFSCVFFAEAVLKVTAYGTRDYFLNRWNLFDFLLVLVSIADLILDQSEVRDLALDPVVLRVFRVFRIFRILRVLRRFRKLTRLFKTLFLSMPALINVGSLLMLLIVVYAIFGVQSFHTVRGSVEEIRNGRATNYDFVNEWANFETFGTALLTLFRCATGESWNGIMHDCYRVSAGLAIVFFVSYFLFCTVFLLNLFIAVILENFSDVSDEYEAPITPVHLRQFVHAWAEFDMREGGGYKPSYTMESKHLTSLLMTVVPPLGLRGTEVNRAQVLKHVRELAIPDHKGIVHMHEVLYACAYRVCGVTLSEREHHSHIAARLTKAFPALVKLHEERPAHQEISTFYAASYVQAAWRGFASREPDDVASNERTREPSPSMPQATTPRVPPRMAATRVAPHGGPGAPTAAPGAHLGSRLRRTSSHKRAPALGSTHDYVVRKSATDLFALAMADEVDRNTRHHHHTHRQAPVVHGHHGHYTHPDDSGDAQSPAQAHIRARRRSSQKDGGGRGRTNASPSVAAFRLAG